MCEHVFSRFGGLKLVELAKRLLLGWWEVVQEDIESIADHVLVCGQSLLEALERAVRLHAGQDDTGSVCHLHEEIEQDTLQCLRVVEHDCDKAFVCVALLVGPGYVTHDVQERLREGAEVRSQLLVAAYTQTAQSNCRILIQRLRNIAVHKDDSKFLEDLVDIRSDDIGRRTHRNLATGPAGVVNHSET